MIDYRTPDWFHLEVAAGVILSGGIVAHATEGVWGLACDPFDPVAVGRISTLKQRAPEKGYILIGAEGEFDPELEFLDATTRTEIAASWPGAVTWVVENRRFPAWVAARNGTVGVRVPGHAQARRLAALCGRALVSTSANPAGRPPARCALAARRYFGSDLDWVLPGATAGHRGASEVRVAATGRVARAGMGHG